MSAIFFPLNAPLSGSPAAGNAPLAKLPGKPVAPVKQVATVKPKIPVKAAATAPWGSAPAKSMVMTAKPQPKMPPKAQPKAQPKVQLKGQPKVAAFNPNLPIAGTPILAEELRDQFNGLAAMIAERATPQQVMDAQALAVATSLANSSNNSNAVGQLGMYADWSYNQSQIQALMDKIDELILTLRRQ